MISEYLQASHHDCARLCELKSVFLLSTFQMFRQKISTNLEAMQALHDKHSWIPGAESIRPNAALIEKKHNYITNMLTRYVTLQDFFLHRIFGLKSTVQGDWQNSKLHVAETEIVAARQAAMEKSNRHTYRFIPNLFSYQVPVGTKHYVIWFLLNGNETIDPTTNAPISDEEINANIEEAIRKLLGSTNDTFSFAWYLNPKPTITSDVLYHVQVFWIPE